MKSIVKRLAATVPANLYQRLLAYSVLNEEFSELKACRTFPTRESLWDHCIDDVVGGDRDITYIEFGVHQGYSIGRFAQRNQGKASRFIGLDSFEGLPEQWGHMELGHFSTEGRIPSVPDHRVSFIKGWFQNTYDELHAQIADRDNFVIHYDADVYSSTLFVLTKIDGLRRDYVAIFDEFTGHETRALYNYIQAYNAKVTFLAKTLVDGYPMQVLCRIKPT